VALLMSGIACRDQGSLEDSEKAIESSLVVRDRFDAAQPVEATPNCDIFVTPPSAPSLLDRAASVSSCLDPADDRLRHAVAEFYDSCESQPWMPIGCPSLPFGSGFCSGGRWTIICRSDRDCGSFGRCDWGLGVGVKPDDVIYGQCEISCTGASAVECLRCDMQCDPVAGVCRQRAVPVEEGIPCSADCECPQFRSCRNGRCSMNSASPARGICGAGGNCPCVGATCRSDGCCVLADGTIDSGFGPACQE